MKPKVFFLVAFVLFALLAGCVPVLSSSTPETDLPSLAAKVTQTPTPEVRVPTTDSTREPVVDFNQPDVDPTRTRAAVILPTTPPKSPTPFKTAVPVVLTPDYFSARTVRENTPVPVPSDPITVESASRIDALARWGKGNANAAAYSPDGSMLAVASSLGIYLYRDGQTLLKVIETDFPVTALVFSPGGDVLAGAMADGQIQFWQWQDEKLLSTLVTGQANIVQLTYFENNSQIALLAGAPYDLGKSLQVWDISKQEAVFQEYGIQSAHFLLTADQQSLLAFTVEWELVRFSITDAGRTVLLSCASPMGCENALVSPDEKNIFYDEYDQNIDALWDISAEQPYATLQLEGRQPSVWNTVYENCHISIDFPGLNNFTKTAAFSPDGSLLAIGMNDDSVRMIRVSDGETLYATPQRSADYQVEYGIRQIVFSPDQTQFTILYENGLIETQAVQNGELLTSISGHTRYFHHPVFFPDGKSLAAAASDNLVRIWSLPQGQRSTDLDIEADTIALSPNGEYLSVGGRDRKVYTWQMNTGIALPAASGHLDRVYSLAFLPDNQTLVSGSRDCTFKVWSVGNAISPSVQLAQLPPNPLGFITAIQSSPDGKWLLLHGNGDTVLYNLESNSVVQKISITGVSTFSPDSQYLAFVNSNSLTIVQLETQKNVRRIALQNGVSEFGRMDDSQLALGALAYSPDGQILAVGSTNGDIQLFDATTGKILVTFHAHRGTVTGLAFFSRWPVAVLQF